VRKFALLLVSTAGLMVQSGIAMADGSQASPDAAQVMPSDPDKLVCKSMAPPTGTRLGSRRECKTQREWDDIQRQARQQTEHQQDNGFKSAVPNGG